jgi:EAL domain-containing protein (putative c-di-GMP-specific phosphodiesterase class I)
VRWRHPYLGLIHPEGFIPLAEQTNLIKPLTAWVLDAALGQCRQWRNRGLDVPVAVNLSTRSLLDRRLPGQIDALLAKWQLPASALQLEITETKIIADFGCARDVLEALRSAGVRVAIDDFGTGYSSLAQLQQLPADEIKIDKRFVRNMEHDENDAAIVRSTIGLGQNLALDITAEGVETQEVFDRLEGMGCDFLQGYHLSRPVPADACERELRDWIARENVKEASWRAAA